MTISEQLVIDRATGSLVWRIAGRRDSSSGGSQGRRGATCREESRVSHALVEAVGDEQETLDARRDHDECDGNAEERVEDAKDFAGWRKRRHVAVADCGEHCA